MVEQSSTVVHKKVMDEKAIVVMVAAPVVNKVQTITIYRKSNMHKMVLKETLL